MSTSVSTRISGEYEKFLTRRSLGYRLKTLSALLARVLNEELEAYRLTRSHWVVLGCLWHEQGVPVSEIANKVQQIGGTLTGVLDRMEKRKLLKRKRDRKDRRIWRVWLTAEGERLLKVLPPIVHGLWERALGDLSPAERELFSELVNQALRNCCPEYRPTPPPGGSLLPPDMVTSIPPYSLGYRLKLLALVIGRIFTDRCSSHNVTVSHWIVLCCLWQQDGAAVSEVGAYLEQVGGTLAGVLERMEERGLIHRASDPNDKRCVRIYLSDSGTRLFDVLPPIAKSVLDDTLAGISPQDMTFFESVLERLIANLS